MVVTKEMWTAALRSGKYEQGRSRLCNSDGEYCCLGVFCAIGGMDPKDLNVATSMIVPEGDCCQFMPEELTEAGKALKLDQRSSEGMMSNQVLLAEMNDDGQTFEEIADWIEEHL